MITLYVTEQGAMVKRSGRRIVITENKRILVEKPIFDIASILLFGNIQVTTQAISLCLENGVDLSFFSTTGKFRGRLVGNQSKNIYLRMAQVTRWQDKKYRLDMAKIIVKSKIRSQLRVINTRRFGIPVNEWQKEVDNLLNEQLKKVDLINTEGELRGLEGITSKSYFSYWDVILPENMQFQYRSRRPAENEVNSALNFSYTLLLNEVNGVIEAKGLDPMFGFYHSMKYGRVSLSLDLMEPLRAILVDHWLITLIRRKELKKEDFIPLGGEAVRLTDAGRKKFLSLHSRWMTQSNYRGRIQKIVNGYAESVMEGTLSDFGQSIDSVLSDML